MGAGICCICFRFARHGSNSEFPPVIVALLAIRVPKRPSSGALRLALRWAERVTVSRRLRLAAPRQLGSVYLQHVHARVPVTD